MDIPINVDVRCTDGRFGQTSCVIINPTTKDVTHVVVKSEHIPYPQFLVPIEFIVHTTPRAIELKCSQQELEKFEKFASHEFIHVDEPTGPYSGGAYALWPYVQPMDDRFVELVHERIPSGETALHRGAEVVTADGPVGRVDELLIEPNSGHITHLVLRNGHLWGKKDVVIPVSAVDEILDETVYLKATKKEIEAMPTVAIKRWWQ